MERVGFWRPIRVRPWAASKSAVESNASQLKDLDACLKRNKYGHGYA